MTKDLQSASRQGYLEQIPASDYIAFRDFLQQACGIYLSENKQYLVSTRIRKILTDHNLETLHELLDRLTSRSQTVLRDQVIDAMTTNETFWFRDGYPYDCLQNQLLPELNAQSDASDIRIWSAACSSGQEPYSISMIVEECRQKGFTHSRRQVQLVATDLSTSMLDQACNGKYDRMSTLRGLSSERRDQFFDALTADEWQIRDSVRRRVQFKSLNLLHSYSGLGKFDIIFCRNVLIYFTAELKLDILTRMHAALKPNGVLFLGSSEGVSGAAHLFDMVHCNPGIYYRAK